MPRAAKFGTALVIGLVLALGLYFACAAYLLRFDLDAFLFLHVSAPPGVHAPVAARIVDASGNELLLRRYGQARIGCAIFFPGQHGELSGYQATLFRKFADAGVAVFAVDYPGQDGAAGSLTTRNIFGLSRRAVRVVARQCGERKTVILGRSLGSMVAVYAAQGAAPAGIVLYSAAPSLSDAIAARVRFRWYLHPLALLPIHGLLRHDYSLAEALVHSPNVRVVVFQGTADRRTPMHDLQRRGALPWNVHLVPVPGATHANTYQRALDAYVETALGLLPAPLVGCCESLPARPAPRLLKSAPPR